MRRSAGITASLCCLAFSGAISACSSAPSPRLHEPGRRTHDQPHAPLAISAPAGRTPGSDTGAGHPVPPVPTPPGAAAAVATPPTPPSIPQPIPAPAPPSSAAALFADLVPVEEAIRDSATDPAARDALGAREQHDVATLADHPDWVAQLPATTPVAVRAAIAAIVRGDDELAAIPGPAASTIPAWKIVAPQPAAELLATYRAAETATGAPWPVLAAIHLVETRMGRIQGPSSAGAQGPMQFIPATWASFGAGGDIASDHDAIFAAGRFLAHYGAPRDVAGALFHYNASTHYVRAVLAYASVMAADEHAYGGFHGWQVFVATTRGEYLLPTGYDNRRG